MASSAASQGWTRATTIAIGFAIVCAVTLFNHYNPTAIESIELSLSDFRVYRRHRTPPTGAVVIATIDDKSIAEFGRFPWPRSVQARLVRSLTSYKAAVVAFDVFFSEEDPADIQRETIAAKLRADGIREGRLHDLLGEKNDLEFANAIREQGATYLAYAFSSHMLHEHLGTDLSGYKKQFQGTPPVAYNIVRKGPDAVSETFIADAYLPPIQVLDDAARGTGYVDIDEDIDGTERSFPSVIRFNGRYCAPLFLAAIDAYLGNPPLSLSLTKDGVGGIAIGGHPIPVDESGKMMLHYRGKPGTLPHFSVADIIDHRIQPAALKDRIVIVGVTAHALGDRFVTPVGGDFPGVEIQATAVDNVLAGDFLHTSLETLAEEKWVAWTFGVVMTIVSALMTATSGAMVLIILGLGYLLYASWLLTSQGIVIGVLFPIIILALTYLGCVSYRYTIEGREKRFIRSAFELYVNPDYVASLMQDSKMLKLGGERRHLSILFSDIMNFTSRAERSEPEPLVALLNTYMTAMTNVIFETGGVVDKLMGDGIMAFWGAPIASENPARDAIECALKMHEELRRLAERDERFRDVHIGIGIATGDVIVGNFGGDKKFDYSVIGDTVNLASRLEGLTRQFKVDVIVNLQTYTEAGAGYVAREIGLVKVKGKDQRVAVVEIAGRENDSIDPVYYRRFREAMSRLQKGDSPELDLQGLLRERPQDHVVEMCLERLKEADGTPPREMVFDFETK